MIAAVNNQREGIHSQKLGYVDPSPTSATLNCAAAMRMTSTVAELGTPVALQARLMPTRPQLFAF